MSQLAVDVQSEAGNSNTSSNAGSFTFCGLENKTNNMILIKERCYIVNLNFQTIFLISTLISSHVTSVYSFGIGRRTEVIGKFSGKQIMDPTNEMASTRELLIKNF